METGVLEWVVRAAMWTAWTAVVWAAAAAVLAALGLRVWAAAARRSGKKHGVVVGLFHPYCNAGGGGERVLWCGVRALQAADESVRCVVYTGDANVTGAEILARARERFGIELPRPQHVHFVFLRWRSLVEASRYPAFTLLGQSVGSVLLGAEALVRWPPHVYIDTMGYAFTLPLFRWLGGCGGAVAAYVHYPTISTDMLERVVARRPTYNNSAVIASSTTLSAAKLLYYRLFARLYGLAGASADAVAVNSSWTKGHIDAIWGARPGTVCVFPPCDTASFGELPLGPRSRTLVSVAQFRPEKNHALQLHALRALRDARPGHFDDVRLVVLGSSRNDDDAARVAALCALREQLGLAGHVDFRVNATFEELRACLATAMVGLHTMWNEHFGIGVVELMAAGVVPVAHDSGGPRADIVVPFEGAPTGYLAAEAGEYAARIADVLDLAPGEFRATQERARRSVRHRFSDHAFDQAFTAVFLPLIRRASSPR